jgi:IMP dehydrogenase
MHFLHPDPGYDLTYNDVFFVPNFSDIDSRFKVDLTSPDSLNLPTPIVVANMNAVAGKRMAETVARRGGLAVLPQDIPFEVLGSMIKYIKSRHLIYETALTLSPDNSVADALNIIHKRSHNTVVILDNRQQPVGIFKDDDAAGHDRFTPLSQVMSTQIVTVPAGLNPQKSFELLTKKLVETAPVMDNNKFVGLVSKKGALRSSIYKPAVDKNNRLMVAVAIGISGEVAVKANQALKLGADVIVVDTAHGHQKRMLEAIKAVRSVNKIVPLVAGNVATAAGVQDMVNAGADIVKVGVGPGAMCTTRMMTGVGRPQFSAVVECAAAANELGKHIWADGGIKYPRDVALALAGGAGSAFIGTWLAGTHESAGDIMRDSQGRLYKENYGMASKRAVRNRNRDVNAFELARRELFEEGTSKSRLYLREERPGVEDLIDQITAGLRSSMSYSGAKNIQELQDKAVVGIQSASGYQEGQAIETNWD